MPPGAMAPLARHLRRAGYDVLAPWYRSWDLPLATLVEQLTVTVAAFAQSTPGPLHFVGHSMGGLMARALIHSERPVNLGHVVMLGTPNQGSELADALHGRGATRLILGKAAAALITRRDAATSERLGGVDYSLGIIAGDRPMFTAIANMFLPHPNDGKVSVAATHLEGESDHIVLPLSHSMLPYHRAARRQVLHFLDTGSFDLGRA